MTTYKNKKIRHLIAYLIFTLNLQQFTVGQVNITTDGAPAHGSAQLEVKSNNKGLLLPRVNTPSNTVAGPAAGLLVYDQSKAEIAYFNGAEWKGISGNESLYERFPNSKGFPSNFNTGVSGSPNLTDYTFVVPNGVNKIWVEAWGGGRAGIATNTLTAIKGGAGGDYLSTILTVTGGNTMSIRVSKGEATGNLYSNTLVYPNISVTSAYLYASSGGLNSNYKTGTLTEDLIKWVGGEPAQPGIVSYQNLGATGFIFANAPGGGAYPSYSKSPSNTFIFNAARTYQEIIGGSNYGSIPGGGGPGVSFNDTSFGGPGLVILHW